MARNKAKGSFCLIWFNLFILQLKLREVSDWAKAILAENYSSNYVCFVHSSNNCLSGTVLDAEDKLACKTKFTLLWEIIDKYCVCVCVCVCVCSNDQWVVWRKKRQHKGIESEVGESQVCSIGLSKKAFLMKSHQNERRSQSSEFLEEKYCRQRTASARNGPLLVMLLQVFTQGIPKYWFKGTHAP